MERLRGKADLAVVLGSGLDALGELVDTVADMPYREVPHLRAPTVPGHRGTLALARLAGRPLYLFSGRLHCYEGLSLDEAGGPARVAAELGCSRLLLTQAAGSLRRELPIGEWMLADDIVSFPWSAVRSTGYSARSPALGDLFSRSFMNDLRAAASASGIRLHGGTLFWTAGPAYETPAEARAAVEIGARAASMSAFPELAIARSVGIETALLSCITNYAAPVLGGGIDHGEVTETARKGVRILAALLGGLPPRSEAEDRESNR
jgi:purine-nucleoside phosphorylase